LETRFQIFLSYARKDLAKVQEIYRTLSSAGFKPWMDVNDILPGESFEFSIRSAIRGSDFFLACVSSHSVNRRGLIQKEIKAALETWLEKLDHDIYLIPVRLEPCAAPDNLSSFQWVDLFGEDKDKGWVTLLNALREAAKRLGRTSVNGDERASYKEEAIDDQRLEALESETESSDRQEDFDLESNRTQTRLRRIPHNLPPRHEFIGRTEETHQIFDALRIRSPIVIVEGISGIGKTSLVLQAAYDCLMASRKSSRLSTPTFKAIVWASARSRLLLLQDILDTIARTLDKQYILNLPNYDKYHEILRLMRSIDMLLIIDNFESIHDNDVFDFLNHLPEPSKCIVTTRTLALLDSFPTARRITLQGLKTRESYQLLSLEFSKAGIILPEIGSDKLLPSLIDATGGCPLAIQWAVGQVTQKAQGVETVITNLRGASGALFETIFGRSWSLLSNSGQKLLVLASLFTSASKAALEAASDLHGDDLQAAMDQLVLMRLVESNKRVTESDLRFTIHPLTRAYVANKIAAFPLFTSGAYERLHGFYISLLKRCNETSEQGFDLNNGERHFEVIDLEIENIQNIAERNFNEGRLLFFIETVRALGTYLDNRGYVSRAIDYGLRAVAAAREINDLPALAESLGWGVAWFLNSQGQHDKAEPYANESLTLYKDLGDWFRYGTIMSLCASIAEGLGHKDKAVQLLNAAALILPKYSSKPFQLGHIEMIRGDVARLQGNTEEGLQHYRKALYIFENFGPAMGVLRALGALTRTEIHNGLIDQAETDSLLLIKKCCGLRGVKTFSHALLNLALIANIKGNSKRAKSLARDALIVSNWVGDQRRQDAFETILGSEFGDSSVFSPDDVHRIVWKRCSQLSRRASSGLQENQ
jgi:tetratricopeptide (TPR) repeat protein